MLQEQIRRKKRVFPKGKPSGETEDVTDIPLIDGTLNEIDQALARSEDILKRPTEENIANMIKKSLAKKSELKSHFGVTKIRSCTC